MNIQITGQGPTIIWGHGLMSSIESEDAFNWLHRNTLPGNLRQIRYDARGHGQTEGSSRPDDYHWANLAQDMLAIADATQAGRFIAAGASMGCATAIHAAVHAPARIGALILLLPPTAWETRAGQGKFYRRMALAGQMLGGTQLGKLVSRGVMQSLPHWLAPETAHIRASVQRGMAVLKRKTLWNLFQGAAGSDLPARAMLETLVDIPTIIIGWNGDATHPVSTAQELHRLLPKSELFIAQTYDEFKSIPTHIAQFVTKLMEKKPA